MRVVMKERHNKGIEMKLEMLKVIDDEYENQEYYRVMNRMMNRTV